MEKGRESPGRKAAFLFYFEMGLLGLVALTGLIASAELRRIARVIDAADSRPYSSDQPFRRLQEGKPMIIDADGALHLPGCKSAVPPVRTEPYRRKRLGNNPLCSECNS